MTRAAFLSLLLTALVACTEPVDPTSEPDIRTVVLSDESAPATTPPNAQDDAQDDASAAPTTETSGILPAH